jgi:hypothetical protein
VDRGFAAYAKRRVGQLDTLNSVRVQEQTLSRLVRKARHTAFGRDHEFATLATVAAYQNAVPLRGYDEFWAGYWRDRFPVLRGATWPSAIPYLALSSGTTTGSTKYIPVSAAMNASNRRAALTTLALHLSAYPNTPLFAGRIFFLGGSTDMNELRAPGRRDVVRSGDLSGIAALEVSRFLRPYTFPPLEIALDDDWDRKLDRLARESVNLPITVVSGVPSWLLVLFERVKSVAGKSRITEVWPDLKLIVHGGTKFDPYRVLFQQEFSGGDVRFLETYPSSEGFIAAEDPRYGLLRLVPDHGIFFEFVPMGELNSTRPTRHTVAQVEPGVQYAVAVTTCAGLWSYVLGDTVCFEKRDPPLLRFTGRTRYFLSAFGEHLISEEIERAVAEAAAATSSSVCDFHVGPQFPTNSHSVGHHRYLVEFVDSPADLVEFGRRIDIALARLNEDYRAHRKDDLTMGPPEIVAMPRGAFADWLRSRGQLGGQHKVARMDNSGHLTQQLYDWFIKS